MVGMERRVAVRAIIIDDGKLFCVRQKNYREDGLSVANYWCTPGGGVDLAEPLISALHREMIEETGIKPVIGQLLYVQQYVDTSNEHIEFFFHVTNAADYKTIDLTKTSHGETEIAEYGFFDPCTTVVKPTFLTEQSLPLPNDLPVAPQFFSYNLS